MQEEANLQGDDLGGRGVFLVGVCCPVLQILTYHRPKRGGGRAWGEDFIVDVGPGLGLFPGGGDI